MSSIHQDAGAQRALISLGTFLKLPIRQAPETMLPTANATTLINCPTEVVGNIFSYLDVGDFSSLRLTCHDIYQKSVYSFAVRFLSSIQVAFEDLMELARLSEDDRFQKRIRHINFGQETVGMAAPHHRVVTRDDFPEGGRDFRFDYEVLLEQAEKRAVFAAANILKDVFTHLPEFKTISIGCKQTVKEASASRRPCLPNCSQCTLYQQETSTRWKIYNCIFNAMGLIERPLMTTIRLWLPRDIPQLSTPGLDAKQRDAKNLTPFGLPKSQWQDLIQNHINGLHIHIDPSDPTDALAFAPAWTRSLFKHAHRRLESLTISIATHTIVRNANGQHHLLRDIDFPALKSLTLEHSMWSGRDLCRTLRALSGTLESVSLVQCKLKGLVPLGAPNTLPGIHLNRAETWTSVMQTLLEMHATKLQHLNLDHLVSGKNAQGKTYPSAGCHIRKCFRANWHGEQVGRGLSALLENECRTLPPYYNTHPAGGIPWHLPWYVNPQAVPAGEGELLDLRSANLAADPIGMRYGDEELIWEGIFEKGAGVKAKKGVKPKIDVASGAKPFVIVRGRLRIIGGYGDSGSDDKTRHMFESKRSVEAFDLNTAMVENGGNAGGGLALTAAEVQMIMERRFRGL